MEKEGMSKVTQNTFITATTTNDAFADQPTTIFFICGNPGLIGYYHEFLSLLSAELASSIARRRPSTTTSTATTNTINNYCSSSPTRSYTIYGPSLGGFEIDALDEGRRSSSGRQGFAAKELYSLEQQIEFVQRKLEAFILANMSSCPRSDSIEKTLQQGPLLDPRAGSTASHEEEPKRPRVILVGHSVGTYMAMEILRRHREGGSEATFNIVGAILLFPTVMDIAASPAGKLLTVGASISFAVHKSTLVSNGSQ
jgi:Lipid-droplet associated hydrolase